MADSAIQKKVEKWVIESKLPEIFGQAFVPRSLPLEWGGVFEFDGVSTDGTIGVCVSTSSYRTGGDRGGSGKAQKIKADTLYLLHSKTLKRRFLVFTEEDMLNYFKKQQEKGRFPVAPFIELLLVQIPENLAAQLAVAKQTASSEVTPQV